MSNSTITVKDIEEIMDSMPKSPIVNNPFIFAGLKVFEEPLPQPKLKLKESVQVTDEFRAEYNAWLLDTFGRQESLLGRDKCFLMETMGAVVIPYGIINDITV